MAVRSKAEAQKRVDRITDFQNELNLLEEENIVSLSQEQHTAIETYHQHLIRELSSAFDIDANSHEKQLSLGMKITSFLGALGLAASLFFLFYQFWGRFSTYIQVFILVATPLIGLAATAYISPREKTGYFSKIFGFMTITAFVLNISMLGQIFNIAPSENAFLAWAVFSFLLAYATNARLLLAIGIVFLSYFLSAKTGTWNGCYWIDFGERPENFFPAAILLFLLSFLPHHRFPGFPVIYRVFAMLLFFIPVLILANWGGLSYLDIDNGSIEAFYQLTGFTLSAAAIYAGIKKGWTDVINTGNIFFTIFLYTKLYDWWWEWMPKYLFFFLIGLTAILMLYLFKRLRSATIAHSREVSK